MRAAPLVLLPARLLLVTALLGCAACTTGGVSSVDGALQPGVAAVDFGTVLEGEEVVREVPFTNTGRGGLELSLEAPPPFSAPPALSLPGGATVPVQVRFVAGDGVAEGPLRARVGERTVEVALRGEGVHALACLPSAACRTAEFSLEARACVEHVAEDGTACTPDSLCVENGACRGGDCLGTARSCDDANVCTTDGCAVDLGCVHTPVRCPPPRTPCEQSVCDPVQGCRWEPLPEGTVCGASCEAVSLCQSGQCVPVPALPTDGFPCAPATPCRDQGTCKDRKCALPPPHPLAPSYRVELPGAPVSALRGFAGNVYAAACGGDGGCALVSYTSAATHGFERYTAPLPGPAELVSVSEGGALLLEEDALALHALAPPGAERWRFGPALLAPAQDGGTALAAVTAPDRIVTGPAGEVLAAWSWRPRAEDGGEGEALLPTQTLVQLAPDGGVVGAAAMEGLGTESLLAGAGDGTLALFSPEGPVALAPPADGGMPVPAPVASLAGPRSLVVGSGRTVLGGQAELAADGGTAPLVFVGPDEPPVSAVGQLPVLVDSGALLVFGEGCARGSGAACRPGLRVYRFAPGQSESVASTQVLAPGEPGRLVEAAVLFAPGMGSGVGALTEQPGDGGTTLGVLRLLAGGEEVEQCLLPDAPDQPRLEQVARALFDGEALYVVVRREGRWWLEGYVLSGISASESGWPQAAGVAGSRRAR